MNVEAVGNTTFGYSPLAEVATSLRLLGGPRPNPAMRPWLTHVKPALDQVDLPLLLAVVPQGKWAPEFMFTWSPHPRTTIDQQLEVLARRPKEELEEDLADCWPDGNPPAALREVGADPKLGQRLADAIAKYWCVAIEPFWPRMRAILDDEVAHRGTQVLTAGIFTVFDDLHHEVRLEGETLYIDKPQHRDRTEHGTRITLLPSVFAYPSLVISRAVPNRFNLIYPARGFGRAWEGLTTATSDLDDLTTLVGRTRALLLHRLETPSTTTELARELSQSPGTVSEHLTVLRRNGLLESWRAGRRVLYRRTALASSVIGASRSGATSN